MQKNEPHKKAADAYGILHWGADYFNINSAGELIATPLANKKASIAIEEVIKKNASNHSLPILIRFLDIIDTRLTKFNLAFNAAAKKHNYQGKYTAVYPIKVNQQKSVVQQILKYNKFPIGLEAGSKAEMLTILALANDNTKTIICNGYKDKEYLKLAFYAQLLGFDIAIIIEKLSELKTIATLAQELEITPKLGIRLRLTSVAKGNWQNTGGAKAKFGLCSGQILAVIDTLKKHNMLSALQVLHFHMGSQIANIFDLKKGLQEGAQNFVQLAKNGVKINAIDVGGGLGVDYEGSNSRNFCSLNYTLNEYANTIIQTISKKCQQHKLTHPNIITESGRATVAHHALLVTNVVDIESPPCFTNNSTAEICDSVLSQQVQNINQTLSSRNVVESYHKIKEILTEVITEFNYDNLSLQEKSTIEFNCYKTFTSMRNYLNSDIRSHHEILEKLRLQLASKVFCNFSIFQSIPDAWAIEQIFPIMPTRKLEQDLKINALIKDLTCDSDGRIDKYIHNQNIENTLLLPEYNNADPFNIAFLLVGAYQEPLGDIHNLFGKTNTINIVWDDKTAAFVTTEITQGDAIKDVLKSCGYDTCKLVNGLGDKIAISTIKKHKQKSYIEDILNIFAKCTYLD